MTPAHAIGGAPPSDDDPTAVARAPEPLPSPVLDQLRMLLRADGAATLLLGMDATVLDVNDVARVRLGLGDEDPLDDGGPGRSVLRSLLDQVPQRLFSDPAGGTWHGEVDLTQDGAGVVLEATVLVHHDPSSAHGGFVAAIARDVSDLHRHVDRLQHDLHHDAVTGLMNRMAALTQITDAVDRDGGTHVAVLVIDVDRLADVNDALGHEIGDRLLASTAKRLASAVRPDDTVARIGGDEFMVLCHDVADVEVAAELADRIRRSLTGRLTIKDLELDVSVSVGVATVTPDLVDHTPNANPGNQQPGGHQPGSNRAVELLTRADTAVRAAKQAGALSRALRHEELTIEYQPIFSAVSEQAEAAEALVRWDHPTRGRLQANEFVGVAEDTGIILAIGEWVLRQACADTRHWIEHGVVGQRFAVHVNVSRLQLTSPTFVNSVVELLREHQLRPRQLVLEARETTLLGESADVARTVRALRRVGVRVALDNFGTGANALSILTDIGADVLKLDGGLALPTGSSDADTRVVRALVLLAHALNMDVVAERVTGLEQLRRLRAAGCDLVQGHLLGRPCPPEDFHVYGRPSG
jgi:diguanylate cyclase (GGDEF)-like protein